MLVVATTRAPRPSPGTMVAMKRMSRDPEAVVEAAVDSEDDPVHAVSEAGSVEASVVVPVDPEDL